MLTLLFGYVKKGILTKIYYNMNLDKMDLLRLSRGEVCEVIESDVNAGTMKLDDYSVGEYDDKVILHGDVFKELFNSPRYNTTDQLKLLAIVKITNNRNGKSIHRAFLGKKGMDGLTQKMVGLSPNSIRLLNGEDDKPEFIDSVTISRGSTFWYYWNHPFHAIRFSMRLGLLSLIVAVLSIIISIIY